MTKKDIIQLIITGVLLIVLVRLIAGLGGKKDKNYPVLLGGISYEQIIGESIGSKMGLYARLEDETKNLKIRRSPFSNRVLVSATGPYLNGIFWDPVRPRAIINDKIVESGSRLTDYTVVDIKKDHVILIDHKKQKELRLELLE